MDYLTYGGLPGALEYPNGSHSQREYIKGFFKTIIEKDVLKRSGKGRFLVERIVRYLTDTVGSLTSPNPSEAKHLGTLGQRHRVFRVKT